VHLVFIVGRHWPLLSGLERPGDGPTLTDAGSSCRVSLTLKAPAHTEIDSCMLVDLVDRTVRCAAHI
jgi:hypothetical protein